MRQLHISLPARRDLDAIWVYSVEQWAEMRADDYIRAIHAATQLALDDPEIGTVVGLRPAFRKLPQDRITFTIRRSKTAFGSSAFCTSPWIRAGTSEPT